MLNLKKQFKEFYKILDDISNAKTNFNTVILEVNELEARYQNKQLNYNKYLKLKNNILSNKTIQEVKIFYKNYTISKKNQLIKINTNILNLIYKDKSFENLVYGEKIQKKPTKLLPPLSSLDISEIEISEAKKKKNHYTS